MINVSSIILKAKYNENHKEYLLTDLLPFRKVRRFSILSQKRRNCRIYIFSSIDIMDIVSAGYRSVESKLFHSVGYDRLQLRLANRM